MSKRIAYTITPTKAQDDWLKSMAANGFRSVNSIVLEMIQEKMMLSHQTTSNPDEAKEKAPNA